MVSLESNKEESGTRPWLELPNIMCGLNTSGEMAKTATQNRPITLLAKNISQAAIEGVKCDNGNLFR